MCVCVFIYDMWVINVTPPSRNGLAELYECPNGIVPSLCMQSLDKMIQQLSLEQRMGIM